MKGSVKSHIKQAIPSLVIMVFMVGAASAMSSRFFTAANLRNVLTQTAVLAIVSAAQCFALLIGGIDMSVSSVISVSTILPLPWLWRLGRLPALSTAWASSAFRSRP